MIQLKDDELAMKYTILIIYNNFKYCHISSIDFRGPENKNIHLKNRSHTIRNNTARCFVNRNLYRKFLNTILPGKISFILK